MLQQARLDPLGGSTDKDPLGGSTIRTFRCSTVKAAIERRGEDR